MPQGFYIATLEAGTCALSRAKFLFYCVSRGFFILLQCLCPMFRYHAALGVLSVHKQTLL